MFRNPNNAIVDAVAVDPIESVIANFPRFPSPAAYATGVAHALENWPDELRSLSFPSAGFELTPGEIMLIMTLWGEVELGLADYASADAAWANADDVIAKSTMPISDGDPLPLLSLPLLADLCGRIDALIENLATHGITDPVFKLGTRSPKDSPFIVCSGGRVSSSAQVLLLIFTSTRMLGDIGSDEAYNKMLAGDEKKLHPSLVEDLKAVPPHRTWFWFRAYERFEPYQEFRCMMGPGRDGQPRAFLGATQYHGIVSDPRGRYFEATPFPELVEHGYEYEKLILAWFPTFREACPYEECVFDVIVDRHAGVVILLETNPSGKRTFPGLYDWNRPELFEGDLKWVAEPIRLSAPVISQSDIEDIRQKFAETPQAATYESIVQPKTQVRGPIGNVMRRLFGRDSR
jgi:hypothetical protein